MIWKDRVVVSGSSCSGGRFNYSAGTYTTGANPHLFIVASRDCNPYALQIWQPASSGLIMSMTDIVSGDRTFATYFALLSHFYDSFAMFFEEGHIQCPFAYGKYFVGEYSKV